MKKFLIIFLIAVLCLSIFSCGKEEEANNNTPVKFVEYKVVSAPMTDGPIVMGKAKDDSHNYYLLDLGYVRNVPLFAGVIVHYNGITPVTLEISKSDISEESISNSLTNAVSNTIVDTKIGNASFQINQSFEYGIKGAEAETALSASYFREWGNSTENSFSKTDTYEKIKTKAEENALEFTQTIGEHGEAVGYYKMQLMSTCDVFAFIKTNRDNSELEGFSYYFNARDDITYISIYSEDGTFVERADNKIDLPDDFYKKLPIPTENIGSSNEEITPKPQYDKITTVMPPQSCAKDNEYNTSRPGNDVDKSRHNGFDIGELNLYGCANVDNKYFVGDEKSFAIRYKVLQNTEDLPRAQTELSKVKISSDSATRANNTSINSKIGHGAYWVRITYADGTKEYFKTDVLKYASNGTFVDIVTSQDVEFGRTLEKIEIVLVYEMYLGGPLGIFGVPRWENYVNFRCEYTYEFIKLEP